MKDVFRKKALVLCIIINLNHIVNSSNIFGDGQ